MSKQSPIPANPSMGLKRSPIHAEAQSVVGPALQAVLVDLLDLASQGKQAHWTVVGQNFGPAHTLLDAIVATAQAAVDETAERMTALNIAPDGRVTTVAATSKLEGFPAGPVTDCDAVRLVADRLAGVIERMRAHEASVCGVDAVSDDMLIGFLGTLEKHLWMLQAQEV